MFTLKSNIAMTTSYKLLFWLTLMVFESTDASHNFRIRLERAMVVEQDPEYVNAKMWTAKVNRTEFALSAEVNILKTFPSNAMFTLQCYEFLSNEYRPFAIRLQKTVCDFLKNEYEYYIYRDMPNMFPPKCPLGPGYFTITNYTVPTNRYPENLPFKNTMTEYKIIIGKRILFHLQVYAKYDRDIVIRERYS